MQSVSMTMNVTNEIVSLEGQWMSSLLKEAAWPLRPRLAGAPKQLGTFGAGAADTSNVRMKEFSQSYPPRIC
jgi:hypothetical protein